MNVYSFSSIRHRSTIQKNNEKLKKASESNTHLEVRDQGFTRPSVLILTPFRNSAYELVNMICTLTGARMQANKNRFKQEFYEQDDDQDPRANKKPGKVK